MDPRVTKTLSFLSRSTRCRDRPDPLAQEATKTDLLSTLNQEAPRSDCEKTSKTSSQDRRRDLTPQTEAPTAHTLHNRVFPVGKHPLIGRPVCDAETNPLKPPLCLPVTTPPPLIGNQRRLPPAKLQMINSNYKTSQEFEGGRRPRSGDQRSAMEVPLRPT